MYNLVASSTADLEMHWPHVTKYFDMCADTQDKHEAGHEGIFDNDQLLEHCKRGNGKLLMIFDSHQLAGACLIEILNTEVGRSFHVTNLGAEGVLVRGLQIGTELIEMARRYKCDDVRIYMVRKGWRRFLKPYNFKDIGNREYAGIEYPCISLNLGEEHG